MPSTNWSQLLKTASKQEREAAKPCSFLVGTVKSIRPLTVNLEQKFTLTEEFLVMTETAAHKVGVGDHVFLLRQDGGQLFAILDRMA